MAQITRGGKVYYLGTENGKVEYLMFAGEHVVKSITSAEKAMTLMENGRLIDHSTDYPDTPIGVNGIYLFPGKIIDAEDTPKPARKSKKGD